MKKLILAAVSAALLSAAPLMAEESFDQGDNGYLAFFYPSILFRGTNQPDTGGGAGIKLGGMKGNVFGGYLSAFRTRHDDPLSPQHQAVFTGLTWDLKLSLPMFPVIVPYGSAGVGRYVLERNSQTVYRGNRDGSGINGYQVGMGFDINLSKIFTITIGYTKRRMEFDSPVQGGPDIHQQIREYDGELAFHFR